MPRAKGAIKKSKKEDLKPGPGPGRPQKIMFTRCTRCGREYQSKDRNFYKSYSPLYYNNDKYLPICKDCVVNVYDRYVDALGSDKDAIKRVCMKLDVYWSEALYQSVSKTYSTTPKIILYLRTTNLKHYHGKTYDDTLAEEVEVEAPPPLEDIIKSSEEQEVAKEIVDFWGSGLTPSYYQELEQQLKKWTDGRDIDDIDIGEITVIKKICLLEVMINQDIATGNNKSVEKNVRALDVLLGSANLKPVQKKKPPEPEEKTDSTPFGVWIKKIEEEEPIPEPDEKFRDVDNIARYISVWFFGHLSKVLNVKNRFSNLYEEEIAKYTVERPEYDGYDDEEILEDIFDRARKEAEVEAKRAEKMGDTDEG